MSIIIFPICIDLPTKLKPSTKVYKRDRNNRMTNQYTWKHFTISGATNEELLKAYRTLPRTKNVVVRELNRRGKYDYT